MTPIILTTPRLIVRTPTEADVPGLYPHYSDTGTMAWLPFLRWKAPDDGLAWLHRRLADDAAGNAHQFVIERKEDGAILGATVLFSKDREDRRAELGYMIGKPHWGCGYAREAVGEVVRFAFEDIALHRLEATVQPSNIASSAVLQALGFHYEGILRERHRHEDVPYDIAWYGLLAHEWRARDETSFVRNIR